MALMVLFLAFALLYLWGYSITKVGKRPDVKAINEEAQIEIIVADQMRQLEEEAKKEILAKAEVTNFVEPEGRPDNGKIYPDEVNLEKIESTAVILTDAIIEEEKIELRADKQEYLFVHQDINYGQKKTVQAYITNYDPMLGDMNCWKWENNYCWSATKSGLGWEGLYGIGVACPKQLPHGTVIILPDNSHWICTDWGDMVIIDEDGFYHFDLQSYKVSPFDDKQLHEVKLIIPNSN